VKETVISVVGIVGLVVLGWHLLDVNPQATKEIYPIAVIIGGFCGFCLPKVMRWCYSKIKKGGG